ncbi:MAG: hypothetical protein ACFFCZ_14395 [Promethearchaeota archaeon]
MMKIEIDYWNDVANEWDEYLKHLDRFGILWVSGVLAGFAMVLFYIASFYIFSEARFLAELSGIICSLLLLSSLLYLGYLLLRFRKYLLACCNII